MNPEMSLSEIIEARKKILSNAEALLDEGRILSDHQRYPRAFALAHLACEELAKLPVLNTAALELLTGKKTDWQKIGRRLRSHKDKLTLTAGMDYLWDEVEADASDVRRYEEAISAIPEFNNLKNASLYAGTFHGSFRQPSEVINERLSMNMLQLASIRLTQYQRHEQVFHRLISTEEGKKQLADLWLLQEEMWKAISTRSKP
jgi:AbiV family abortive infection protein